jgi:HSP20 family protein
MNLIRYHYPRATTLAHVNGRSPWRGLESEFDRFFESAFGELSGAAQQDRFPVDLYEDKDNSYVRADLPGLTREDIGLELVNGYLSISAEKKTTDDDGKVTETFSLNRSINVPNETQSDKISASFEHGVLTVTLPKREEAKPKKISIEVK